MFKNATTYCDHLVQDANRRLSGLFAWRTRRVIKKAADHVRHNASLYTETMVRDAMTAYIDRTYSRVEMFSNGLYEDVMLVLPPYAYKAKQWIKSQ